ncbi:hypothetical protein CHI10_10350 [Bacillus sp. 7894-2]|nr:hypothetical protein CHI10_10350 [Bacillus sp. 7894-2]
MKWNLRKKLASKIFSFPAKLIRFSKSRTVSPVRVSFSPNLKFVSPFLLVVSLIQSDFSPIKPAVSQIKNPALTKSTRLSINKSNP